MVVVGRSAGKTAAVAGELPGAVALTADFARLDDVRRPAADLRDRFPRIDVLAGNAGAPDGWRNGRLHADRSPTAALPSALDDVRARELWELSAGLVGLPG